MEAVGEGGGEGGREGRKRREVYKRGRVCTEGGGREGREGGRDQGEGGREGGKEKERERGGRKEEEEESQSCFPLQGLVSTKSPLTVSVPLSAFPGLHCHPSAVTLPIGAQHQCCQGYQPAQL